MIDVITNYPVLCAIICFAVLGLFCAICAIKRIRREAKELNDFMGVIGQKQKSDKPAVMETWLREKLKKNTNDSKNGKEWENGELDIGFSHLVLRVQTLYRALKDENGAQQLPQLHDLRELTLQDEMSHKSTAWLRTIISFLLILGILGTLSGVHSVIDDKINIEDLGAALLPSMVAVLCTVLLLWSRGVYTYFLESYLHKLDKCTITDLMPHLQPESETSQSVRLLNEQKDRLNDSMTHIQDTARHLEDASKILEESMQQYEEVSQAVNRLLKQMQSIVDMLNINQKEQENSQQALETTLNIDLPDKIEGLTLSEEKLKHFTDKTEDVKQLFGEICTSTQESTEKLEKHITLLQQLTSTMSNLPEYARAIRQYEDYLNMLNEISPLVDKEINSISAEHNEIEKLSVKVYESAKTVEKSTDEIKDKLNKISRESGGYGTFVDQQIEQLESEQKELEKRYSELDQASKKLIQTFENRTSAIASTGR